MGWAEMMRRYVTFCGRLTAATSERGDTLVEVVIALGILSLVMVSAFATADAAFKLGQTAKERSILNNIAQQQADALKSFRDSHSWDQFVYGKAHTPYPACNSSPNDYCGVNSRTAGDCDPSGAPGNQYCFHMVLRNVVENSQTVTEWVPAFGPYLGTGGQSVIGSGYIGINADGIPDPGAGSAPYYYYDFTFKSGNTSLGSSSGGNPGIMMLRLVNIDSLR